MMEDSDNLVIEVALVLVTVSVYGAEQSPTPARDIENMAKMIMSKNVIKGPRK